MTDLLRPIETFYESEDMTEEERRDRTLLLSEEHGLVNIPRRTDYPTDVTYIPRVDFIPKVRRNVPIITPVNVNRQMEVNDVIESLGGTVVVDVITSRLAAIRAARDTVSRFRLLTTLLNEIKNRSIEYDQPPVELLKLVTKTDLTSKLSIDQKLEMLKLLFFVTLALVSVSTRSYILSRFLIEDPAAEAKRKGLTVTRGRTNVSSYAIPVNKLVKANENFLSKIQEKLFTINIGKRVRDDNTDSAFIAEFTRILDDLDWGNLTTVKKIEFINYIVDLFTRGGLMITNTVYDMLVSPAILEQYVKVVKVKAKKAPKIGSNENYDEDEDYDEE